MGSLRDLSRELIVGPLESTLHPIVGVGGIGTLRVPGRMGPEVHSPGCGRNSQPVPMRRHRLSLTISEKYLEMIIVSRAGLHEQFSDPLIAHLRDHLVLGGRVAGVVSGNPDRGVQLIDHRPARELRYAKELLNIPKLR